MTAKNTTRTDTITVRADQIIDGDIMHYGHPHRMDKRVLVHATPQGVKIHIEGGNYDGAGRICFTRNPEDLVTVDRTVYTGDPKHSVYTDYDRDLAAYALTVHMIEDDPICYDNPKAALEGAEEALINRAIELTDTPKDAMKLMRAVLEATKG